MRRCYQPKRFTAKSQAVIDHAIRICADYEAQGFTLTLRQLYYQFVAEGLIENTERSYKRLGGIIRDARMAGLIDWRLLEDRTRFVRKVTQWESPAEIVEACVSSYRRDRWVNQAYRVEVWIEKDALIGVIEGICQAYDVPCFSCRGYVSISEMWQAGQRLFQYIQEGQRPVILHLGDHDPSGMDMTRDIRDRLALFTGVDQMHEHGKDDGYTRWETYFPIIERVALSMDQIEGFQPPPNPAKLTDSRARDYVSEFGYESWELDALRPDVIRDLVKAWIEEFLDKDTYDAVVETENEERDRLTEIAADLR